MPKPLDGRTIALPETRLLDVLARLLDDQGASILRCPMVGIVDSPDETAVKEWLEQLAGAEFDDLVLFTGEGLRRLLGFARRGGTYDAVVAALAGVRKITRGPKPAKALGEIGLRPDLPAEAPTTDGLIATLTPLDLAGRTIGVQLYGSEPNDRFVQFLQTKGALVRTVAPYRYAPASDEDHVAALITRMGQGKVDLIAFTSAAQVQRLWEVAAGRGAGDELSAGLNRTRVAAVGPVTADELRRRGARVDTWPNRFAMKPLVAAIVEAIGTKQAMPNRAPQS